MQAKLEKIIELMQQQSGTTIVEIQRKVEIGYEEAIRCIYKIAETHRIIQTDNRYKITDSKG